jgi:MFS superfamily sulfate permease-like transporter
MQAEPGLMIYRFSHSIYYANTELLFSQVTELLTVASPPLRWFCIDAAGIDDVDFTGAATLRAIHQTLKDAGVKLVFANVSHHVRSTVERYEIAGLLDNDALFDSLPNMAHAYERMHDK